MITTQILDVLDLQLLRFTEKLKPKKTMSASGLKDKAQNNGAWTVVHTEEEEKNKKCKDIEHFLSPPINNSPYISPNPIPYINGKYTLFFGIDLLFYTLPESHYLSHCPIKTLTQSAAAALNCMN